MIIQMADKQPSSVRKWVLMAGTVSDISQASLVIDTGDLGIRIRWRNALGRFLYWRGMHDVICGGRLQGEPSFLVGPLGE